MKKFFVMITLILTTLVSCVYPKVDINFSDESKGEYKITVNVDKNAIPKESLNIEIDKLYNEMALELKNTEVNIEMKNLGEKNNQYVYEFNSKFNKLEDLEILSTITKKYTPSFSTFVPTKDKVYISSTKNMVEMYLGKSVAPTTIKVTGKIIEAQGGTIKGKKVEFPANAEMLIKYKKGSNIALIAGVSSAVLLLIIGLTVFGVYKFKKNKKEEF